MSMEMNKAMELLRGLVSEIERQTCEHEETHRGGAIWEICDSCGAKWADDEGGKPEFEWPESVEKAREFLAAHPTVEQAERPEVVARVVHSTPVVLDQCAPLNANDEMMTVAQHAASVARWAEMFNRVEQERDAALASVAELDKQCRDDVARALGLRPSQERGFAWSYLLASIKSCVKASEDAAQAQHSVPEGLALIPVRETEAMHDAVMALLYKGVARTDTQKLLDAYIAAAPGKEVGHE
ncbi:hypothetical protein ACRCOS_01010 [Pseudomonas aeruginosa]